MQVKIVPPFGTKETVQLNNAVNITNNIIIKRRGNYNVNFKKWFKKICTMIVKLLFIFKVNKFIYYFKYITLKYHLNIF